MRWDLYCRVIDNHGDLGVCWRLAADLAARGQAVRLWVDDPAALAWMAPGSPVRPAAAGPDLPHRAHGAVQVLTWDVAAADGGQPVPASDDAPEVLVEAFGCDPAPAQLAALPRASGPVWINLEYLSAESYVERSHGLRSPQYHGPGAGLDKWFCYPGFTPRTGGLLREPGLLAALDRADGEAWRALRGWGRLAGETVVTLFCYDNAAYDACLDRLARSPTLLLLTPGPATRQWQRHGQAVPAGLRVIELPWLSQPEYDRLLASADLNFVRGEDSFVRAQWAGRPFVWQLYPQDDGAHAVKLDAFLDRWLTDAPEALAHDWRRTWRAWNQLAPADGLDALPYPPPAAAREHAAGWRDHLAAQPDLCTQLLDFVTARRQPGGSVTAAG